MSTHGRPNGSSRSAQHEGAPVRSASRRSAHAAQAGVPAPLVWTFEGPFARCLADAEDTLRRAIVLVGDVTRVALLIDLSLPALQARVNAGDAVQPAWSLFLRHVERYGLPAPPRVRHLRGAGPLLTLVIAYRN